MIQDVIAKLSMREMRIALLGLGGLVSAAIIVATILPQVKLHRSAIADANVLVSAVAGGDEVSTRLEEQRARVESIRRRLEGDMVNTPIREVESYVIGRLQRVSWDNSVELVSVEPGTGEKIQVFQEVLFNIELIGQYNDLYRWLHEAREELGFFVVKEFALRREDRADSEPVLLATLSMASYRAVQ